VYVFALLKRYRNTLQAYEEKVRDTEREHFVRVSILVELEFYWRANRVFQKKAHEETSLRLIQEK